MNGKQAWEFFCFPQMTILFNMPSGVLAAIAHSVCKNRTRKNCINLPWLIGTRKNNLFSSAFLYIAWAIY